MAAIGGGEKVNLEAHHVAATLAPERGRAKVLNKDLADLKERMIKMGGESVFKADVAQNDEDMMVNFDQMRRVMDDEGKRVAAEPDKARKADMQKRYDRLMRRYNVYDKLLNNEGLAAMNVEEQRDMMAVMADLPGFCEAISLSTGGKLTIDQARRVMSGKGGVPLTPDQRKVIGEMVTQFANDDKLKARISKSLSKLELGTDDETRSQEIDTLRDNVKNEATKRAEAAKYKTDINTFEQGKTSQQIEGIKSIYDSLNSQIASVDAAYKPASLSMDAINTSLAEADAQRRALLARTGLKSNVMSLPVRAAGRGGDIHSGIRTEFGNVINAINRLQQIKTQYSLHEANIKGYIGVVDAQAKLKTVEDELKQIDKDKMSIATKEGQRSKYADKYKRKIEVTLAEEMKRYWNEVKLTQADQAAQAEAAKKAEVEAATKEAQEKREALAKAMLDKYLHLSFLKYKDGKAVGYCDTDLKKFVKQDMLSRSPARLSRDLLERINTMRYTMPPEYAKEMKKMWEDVGVGKGNPPLTLRDALNSIGQDKWEAWAAEKVPDVMGYAHARGYYFDRLKLTKAQGEFLKRAYIDTPFFEKAAESKEKYLGDVKEMLGTEFVNGKDFDAFKKAMGGDWVKGSKMALKTLAVLGAAGAGAFYLTGGLVANPLVPGSPPGFDLARGLTNMSTNLNQLKDAALQTAALGSRVSGKIIEGGAGFVALNANKTLNP